MGAGVGSVPGGLFANYFPEDQLGLGVAETVLPHVEFVQTFVDIVSMGGEVNTSRFIHYSKIGNISVMHVKPTDMQKMESLGLGDFFNQKSTRGEVWSEVLGILTEEEAVERYSTSSKLVKAGEVAKRLLGRESDYVPSGMRKGSIPGAIISDQVLKDHMTNLIIDQNALDRLKQAA